MAVKYYKNCTKQSSTFSPHQHTSTTTLRQLSITRTEPVSVTKMSHQQDDDHTSQSSHGGSQSCEPWMLDHIEVAMTQLTWIWNEVNAPATIERYTVLSTSETLHDSECPICQEDYDDDQHVAIKLVGTHCSHVFGRNCLQDWIDSGMENTNYCPSCRQSIHGAFSGW